MAMMRNLGAAERRTLEAEISRVSIELAEARSAVTVAARNLMLDMQAHANAKLRVLELEADLLAKQMRFNYLKGDREKTRAVIAQIPRIRITHFEEAPGAKSEEQSAVEPAHSKAA
jgi:hypothetical protein